MIERNPTIMQTTWRYPYHMEGFTNGSGCHFENIRSSAEKI